MANWAVTYTFTNGTASDATQVNQNMTDLINCSSDGTKNMSISALTVGGALTANGAVTLGASSSNDLTVNCSLASSIVIKTHNTYNVGASALSLQSIYLASSDSAGRSTRILGATVASNWTFTLPTGAGTARYRLETDGAGVTSWQPKRRTPGDRDNYSITASVAASALTITLLDATGSSLSASSPVDFVFTNPTNGQQLISTITSNATLVISSGSTLGHLSGGTHYIYVYGIYVSASSFVLGASTSLFDEGTLKTSTAEGGAGASDSNQVLYSTAAQTSAPIVLIARLKSSQATAGTWASAITEFSMPPFKKQADASRYTNAAGTSITRATGLFMDFPTKDYDLRNSVTGTGGGFQATTGNTWRHIAAETGRYRIYAQFASEPPAIAVKNNQTCSIYVNGAEVSRKHTTITSGGGTIHATCAQDTLMVTVGQKIEIQISQDDGLANHALANNAIHNYVTVELVMDL